MVRPRDSLPGAAACSVIALICAALELLVARAPKLRTAVEDAKRVGYAYVVLNDLASARTRPVTRVSGSHHRLRHPDGRSTTVPVHSGQDVPKGTLRPGRPAPRW
jgi:hypothetical protein